MQECMTIIFEEQKPDLPYKVLPKQICQMKMIVFNKIVNKFMKILRIPCTSTTTARRSMCKGRKVMW